MENQFPYSIVNDVIGDPDLGGWRPLPLDLFNKTSNISRSSDIANIKKALQLNCYKIQEQHLREAIECIATKLSNHNSSDNEGGPL